LADDGIDCLYVNGTASEFYAQSREDFQQIVDVFLDELKGRGVRTQIGCNATYTDGVICMIDYVISRGADGVQVVVPFWEKLSLPEIVQYFANLSKAFPDVGITHYNHPRSKWVLGPKDYREIVQVCPNLIGVKHKGEVASVQHFQAILPELCICVGEHILALACMVGARGSYVTLPYIHRGLARKYGQTIKEKDWIKSLEYQAMIGQFFEEVEAASGYDGPGIDKLLGVASGYLTGSVRLRKPCFSPTSAQVEAAR